MDPYFDIKLVRKLQEEVTIDEDYGKKQKAKRLKEDASMIASTGSPLAKDGFGKLCPECYKLLTACTCPAGKAREMAEAVVPLSESEWFSKEKLSRLKARLERVRSLYKRNPKNSEKHEREGVALEGEIEALEKKIAELKASKQPVKEEMKEEVDDTQVKTPAVSKNTDTVAPETLPVVEPDTHPTPIQKPVTPIAPAPGVSPHPKAEDDKLNTQVDLFKGANEKKMTDADALKEEMRELRLDLGRAKKAGDKSKAADIQTRIDGLEKKK